MLGLPELPHPPLLLLPIRAQLLKRHHLLLRGAGEFPRIEPCVPEGPIRIGRVRDVHGRLSEQVRERRGAADVESGAPGGDVGVEVRDDVVGDEVREVLSVFGGSDESVLLGVPTGEDDRFERSPAFPHQGPKTFDHLHERRGARDGVSRAHHPCVSMTSHDDNLAPHVSRYHRHRVPDRDHVRVDLVVQPHRLGTLLPVEVVVPGGVEGDVSKEMLGIVP